MKLRGYGVAAFWLLLILCGQGGTRADNLVAMEAMPLSQPAPNTATLETVPADGKPGGNATMLRVTILKPTEPFYTLSLGQVVARAVPEGTRLRLRFWARSATHNPLRAVVEHNGPPYVSAVEANPILTPDWKQYTATGSPPAYGPNGLSLRFQFGHQAGTVELAGISLEDIGPDPEMIAAKQAVTPDAIQARIRKYRMGDLSVTVLDSKGKCVPNARVTVQQTQSAFLFGCNIFGLQPDSSDAAQKAYQERFVGLFNYATLPFYWGAFEPEAGKPQYERLNAMADWCIAHGLTPKGHPLVWHEVYPDWAPKTPDEAIPLLHQRVTDILTHYKGRIHYWDVLNEANNAASFANGEGAWIKRDSAPVVVQTALEWARAASQNAQNTLLYNDFNTGDENVALLAELQKHSALPDVVGVQSHMHGGVWPLERVWLTAERFSRFGKPVHFTETTVLSGPRRDDVDANHPPADWRTTPEGEATQADYVEKFYSVLFSHPALRAITWWDLSDRDAWQNAPAGLVRKDMSPKPAYTRLQTLIRKTWRTNAEGKTDAKGVYSVHAFYGDYQVMVEAGQGQHAVLAVQMPEGSGSKSVTLVLR